jgi:N-acetylglucosaminyl-diphospho-decaprenol L-rhamnosyltransferase
MAELSILIVNFNTCALTLSCLATVQKALKDLDHEIILVDNASKDDSVLKISEAFPTVKILQNSRNVGFSRANNQGLQRVKGDIIFLINSDTLVLPNTFKAITAGFQAYPAAGMIIPQLLNLDGSLQPSWGQFASAWTEFFFQTFLFKFLPSPYPLGRTVHPWQAASYCRPHSIPWASGACMAVRREVIEKAGMLDDGIFMYGEDMEWCWRIRQSGYEIVFWPDAKLTHIGGGSSKKNYSSWIERSTRGNLRFIQQTRGQVELRWAGLWVCMGSGVRRLIWSMVPLFRPSKKAEAADRKAGYRNTQAIGWECWRAGKLG